MESRNFPDPTPAYLLLASGQIRNDTASLAERLGQVNLQVLDDYDPPSLDLATTEQEDHDKKTTEFEADTAVSLNSLDQVEVETDVDAQLGRGQSGAPVGVGVDTDLSWFSFKDFASEDFPYEQVLSLLSGLLSLFLGFDTVALECLVIKSVSQ